MSTPYDSSLQLNKNNDSVVSQTKHAQMIGALCTEWIVQGLILLLLWIDWVDTHITLIKIIGLLCVELWSTFVVL